MSDLIRSIAIDQFIQRPFSTFNSLRSTMSYPHSARFLALCGIFCFQVAFAQEAGTVLLRQNTPHVPSLITTKGTIGDKQCTLIIDTGAEFTVLDRSLNSLLRGTVQNGSFFDSSGRQTPLEFRQAPPMKFQSLEAQNPLVAILDIRPIAKYVDRNLNGVMGISLLRVGTLMVDNDKAILEIHTSPSKLKNGQYAEVELQDYLALPIFETSIERRYGEFLVDTGGLGTISLERSLFTALVRNGSIEVAKSEAHTLGASGMVDIRSGWFIKGELMGKSLVGTVVHETFGKSSIGIEWLYDFNYELDFTLHRFRYQRRREASAPASVFLMIGAILVFGDTDCEVERFIPEAGGAAELAGLNPGDIIEEFDSLGAEELNYASIGELVTKKAGQAIQVRFVRKSNGNRSETRLQLPSLISPWNFGGRRAP